MVGESPADMGDGEYNRGNSSTWEWDGSEKISVQLYTEGETTTYTLKDYTFSADKPLYMNGRRDLCGNITINGGHITAQDGSYAAGIGTGPMSTRGNILIQGENTVAISKKGDGQAQEIGSGDGGTCIN